MIKVRYKCVEKANILHTWSSFHVLCVQAAAFVCPAIQIVPCVLVGRNIRPALSLGPGHFPAVGIFAVVQSARVLVWHCSIVVAQPPSASSDLRHSSAPQKKSTGKGQKGGWFLGLKQGTWIYSTSASRGTCLFSSLFPPWHVLRNSRHSYTPCTFPKAPKHTHKCIHIHHTFAVQ